MELFLGHLKLIEAVISHACRRPSLGVEGNFGRHVKLLDDYAVIREVPDESSSAQASLSSK